jgi:hypothetical protein
MSIEIDTNKFKEYPEIQRLLNGIMQDNKRLTKKVDYLESVLSEILMLNALGKTLKIDQAIRAAVDITE